MPKAVFTLLYRRHGDDYYRFFKKTFNTALKGPEILLPEPTMSFHANNCLTIHLPRAQYDAEARRLIVAIVSTWVRCFVYYSLAKTEDDGSEALTSHKATMETYDYALYETVGLVNTNLEQSGDNRMKDEEVIGRLIYRLASFYHRRMLPPRKESSGLTAFGNSPTQRQSSIDWSIIVRDNAIYDALRANFPDHFYPTSPTPNSTPYIAIPSSTSFSSRIELPQRSPSSGRCNVLGYPAECTDVRLNKGPSRTARLPIPSSLSYARPLNHTLPARPQAQGVWNVIHPVGTLQPSIVAGRSTSTDIAQPDTLNRQDNAASSTESGWETVTDIQQNNDLSAWGSGWESSTSAKPISPASSFQTVQANDPWKLPNKPSNTAYAPSRFPNKPSNHASAAGSRIPQVNVPSRFSSKPSAQTQQANAPLRLAEFSSRDALLAALKSDQSMPSLPQDYRPLPSSSSSARTGSVRGESGATQAGVERTRHQSYSSQTAVDDNSVAPEGVGIYFAQLKNRMHQQQLRPNKNTLDRGAMSHYSLEPLRTEIERAIDTAWAQSQPGTGSLAHLKRYINIASREHASSQTVACPQPAVVSVESAVAPVEPEVIWLAPAEISASLTHEESSDLTFEDIYGLYDDRDEEEGGDGMGFDEAELYGDTRMTEG